MRLCAGHNGFPLTTSGHPAGVPHTLIKKGKMKKLYWLIDGALIWSSAYYTNEDAEEKAKQAEDLSGGNLWLVQADDEPDFSKAESFKHISS